MKKRQVEACLGIKEFRLQAQFVAVRRLFVVGKLCEALHEIHVEPATLEARCIGSVDQGAVTGTPVKAHSGGQVIGVVLVLIGRLASHIQHARKASGIGEEEIDFFLIVGVAQAGCDLKGIGQPVVTVDIGSVTRGINVNDGWNSLRILRGSTKKQAGENTVTIGRDILLDVIETGHPVKVAV